MTNNISGNFSIIASENLTYRGTLNGANTQTMPYATTTDDNASISFYTSFSPDNSNAQRVNVYATLAGDIYAAGDPDTQNLPYHQRVFDEDYSPIIKSMAEDLTESNALGNEIPIDTLSSFATLDADSIQAIDDSRVAPTDFHIIDLTVETRLNNVDRKDGSNTIGNMGEGSIEVTLRNNNAGDEYINRSKGEIIGMKRTIEEE